MRVSPREYYDNHELAEKSGQMAKALISDTETSKLMVFPYNYIKSVKSDGTIADFEFVVKSAQEVIPRIALITFLVPEYLCFSGKEEEIYEIAVLGPSFKYITACRIDSSLLDIVYHHENDFTQLIGRPDAIRQYKHANLPEANNYTISLLKSVFTVAFPVPAVEEPVHNTALHRSVIRLAVAGLNKFSDCFRKHVAIAWASVPHYSFYSFPYAYIRSFDLNGNLISSEKYMMNPATGVLPERPYYIDPQGTVLESFKKRLMSFADDDIALNMLRKGESYAGHGHDTIAIRLCVSAIESILRCWAIKANISFKNSTADKVRIKNLLGSVHPEIGFSGAVT